MPLHRVVNLGDQSVAFRVRIERDRPADLHGDLPPGSDRLDHDHLTGIGEPRGLDRTHAHGSRALHHHVPARLDLHQIAPRGQTSADRVAEQSQLLRRKIGEHRAAVLLRHHHDFAQSAQRRACSNTCVPSDISAMRMRRSGVEELAPVRPSVQALIAHAALRSAGNHHAVADLDALHQRPDCFHHAHAGMIRDRRLLDGRGRKCAADDRVANRRRLRANHDLARLDREQLEFLDRRARATPDKSLESAPGLSASELRRGLSSDHLRS